VVTRDDAYAAYVEEAVGYYRARAGLPVILTGMGLSTAWGAASIGDAARGRLGGRLAEPAAAAALAALIGVVANRTAAGVILTPLLDAWDGVAWNTAPLHRRGGAWCNVLTASSGLGLVAVEPQTPVYVDGYTDDWHALSAAAATTTTTTTTAGLARVGVAYDAGYVYLLLERADGPWTGDHEAVVSLDSVPGQGAATWRDRPGLALGHPADTLVHVVNLTVTIKVRRPRPPP
jgi:hypothetical protein